MAFTNNLTQRRKDFVRLTNFFAPLREACFRELFISALHDAAKHVAVAS